MQSSRLAMPGGDEMLFECIIVTSLDQGPVNQLHVVYLLLAANDQYFSPYKILNVVECLWSVVSVLSYK